MNIKVGFYAGKCNAEGNIEECCFAGQKADIIILGTFDESDNFTGRVITNLCDNSPTDTLLFRDQSVWDLGGIAENENGINLWDEVSKEFPNLLVDIDSLYEFLEADSDEEHYSLSKEIPDDKRLFCLFEGKIVNLSKVKKGNGEFLNLEIFL